LQIDNRIYSPVNIKGKFSNDGYEIISPEVLLHIQTGFECAMILPEVLLHEARIECAMLPPEVLFHIQTRIEYALNIPPEVLLHIQNSILV
jgi:hypothetical protein